MLRHVRKLVYSVCGIAMLLGCPDNVAWAAPNVTVIVPVLYSYGTSRPAEFNWTFTSANGSAPRIGQFACGSYWVAPASGDTGVKITALTGKSGQNDLLSCDADPLTERHGLLSGVNAYGSYDATENILTSLPKTYSPATGSCVSLVAAMQRNEAETGQSASPRNRGECLDAICVVTILRDVPANNGSDMIRPNFTGATKEFLTWSSFDLTRIPTYSFIPSRSAAEWTKVQQRWCHSTEVFSLGFEATAGSNSFSVASEGGRAFRSILVHDDYAAGKAATLNDNILGLFTSGNTLTEKKPALAAIIAHGLDTYHARYNYGTAKRKAWASGAGQYLGQFAPPALAAALLTNTTKANVLKQAATTRFGTDVALQGPQELQQIKRGMSNQILWGDGYPFLRANNTTMCEADWRYWADFSASKCYDNYAGTGTPDANKGKKTAADPYGYHDGPANKPGTAYMGVSYGGFRGFAAIMVLMPKFRETVNTDDPVEYADRVARFGLWAWPDPVATIPPAEQDTCSLWYNVSGAPNWGITWGPKPTDVRYAFEDGTADGQGRFKSLHGTACPIAAGYECGLAKNNWTSIMALYTGPRYDDGGSSLPAPWVSADIGAPTPAGSATHSSGTFSIVAGGTDIYGTSDKFHYVYQPLSGDADIKIKVDSMANVNAWAKAGIMIRDGLAANAKNAFMLTTPSTNGARFQARTATGGSTTSAGGSGTSIPYWLRLVRTGTTFTGYKSSDGNNWGTAIGSATISMGSTVYVGLAVTSHASVTTTASISDVTIGSGGDTQAPTVPTGLAASNITSSSVYLSWNASTDNVGVTGYKVYTNGANPVTVTSTSTTINGLTASTTYSFSVSAHDAAGNNSAQCTAIQATTLGGGGTLPSPWVTSGIGSTAGAASESSGTWTISGGGLDIGGTADAFRYVYQPLAGDVDIKIKINTLTNTSIWAKAGVMVRDGLAANAKFAMANSTPTTKQELKYRTTTGGTGGGTAVTGTALANWVRLTRVGDVFTAYRGTDGTNWTIMGTAQTITMGSTVYVGMAVCAQHASLTTSANITNVTVSMWSGADIGTPPVNGSFSESSGTWTIAGSGIDICASSTDQFYYVYRPLSGDCDVRVRVQSLTNSSAWAKAGIMIRDGLAANAKCAMASSTPTSKQEFKYRTSTGGTGTGTAVTGTALANYVRLVRSGNSFTGYRSPDGVTWTQVGTTQTITMGSTVYVGFAVTAQHASSSTTGVFTNVTGMP